WTRPELRGERFCRRTAHESYSPEGPRAAGADVRCPPSRTRSRVSCVARQLVSPGESGDRSGRLPVHRRLLSRMGGTSAVRTGTGPQERRFPHGERARPDLADAPPGFLAPHALSIPGTTDIDGAGECTRVARRVDAGHGSAPAGRASGSIGRAS